MNRVMRATLFQTTDVAAGFREPSHSCTVSGLLRNPTALPTRPESGLRACEHALVNTPPTDRAATPVFDAHLHIIDPRFPIIENNGYLPPNFTVPDYRERTASMPISGGAVVSGSFQGFDQSYLIAALEALGPGFVGVTQLPLDVDDATILDLDAVGVRAVRANLFRGGSLSVSELERLALRVHDVAGWHTELYVDSHDLPVLAPTLRRLPQITIDHLGLRDDDGTLLSLVEAGAIVKATGFGRIDVADPDSLMAAIVSVNPRALVFGTDLPSTRARTPFTPADLDRVAEAVGDELMARVLHDNARDLYRLT